MINFRRTSTGGPTPRSGPLGLIGRVWRSGLRYPVIGGTVFASTIILMVVVLASPPATVTGTVLTATEADIRDGGSTVVITLPGNAADDPKWLDDGGALPAAAVTALVAGFDGSDTTATGFDTVVKPNIGAGNIARDSDKQITITLPAASTYDIVGPNAETVAVTIPTSAITGGVVVEAKESGQSYAFHVTPLLITDITTLKNGLTSFAQYLKTTLSARLANTTYAVQAGDTCASVQRDRGLTLEQLLSALGEATSHTSAECDAFLAAEVGNVLTVPQYVSPIGQLPAAALTTVPAALDAFIGLTSTDETDLLNDLNAIDGAAASVSHELFTVQRSKTVLVSIPASTYSYIDAERGEVITVTTDAAFNLEFIVQTDFSFSVDEGGDFYVQDTTVKVILGDQAVAVGASGRLGFVEVTATAALARVAGDESAFSFDLDDADGMTVAEMDAAHVTSSLTGKQVLDLTDITVVDNLVPGTTAGLHLLWSDPDGVTFPSVVDEDDLPITLAQSELGTTGLVRFTNANASLVAASIGWLSAWLGAAGQSGTLGETLPLIEGNIGNVVDVAKEFKVEADALRLELNKTDGDGDLVYDNPTAQEMRAIFNAALKGPGGADAVAADGFSVVLENVGGVNKPTAVEYTVQFQRNIFANDYAIHPGDTCAGIAAAHSITLDELLILNRFQNEAACTTALGTESTLKVGEVPPDLSFDMNLGDSGLDFSVDTQVTINQMGALLTGSITLGIRIKDAADLAADLGIDLGDFDGDGIADGIDTDVDGDGIPESYTIQAGDTCASIAAAFTSGDFELSEDEVKLALARIGDPITCTGNLNALAGHVIPLDPNADSDGSREAHLVTSEDLTLATPCLTIARRNSLALNDLLTRNGYASEAACNAALTAGQVLLLDDEVELRSPLTEGHRVYFHETDNAVGLDLTLAMSDMAVPVHYNTLDLALTGDFMMTPQVTVGLKDPATGMALPGVLAYYLEDDGLVDLPELAVAADENSWETIEMADVLSGETGGPVSAHFELSNGLLSNSPGGETRHLDVVGNLRALDNGAGAIYSVVANTISDGTGGEDTPNAGVVDPTGAVDALYVGEDLHELLGFEDITIDDLQSMLEETERWLGTLKNNNVLKQPIPLVDLQVTDMIDPTDTFGVIASAVDSSGAKDLTDFHDALCLALTDNGLSCGLEVIISDEDVRLAFEVTEDQEGVMPLNFRTGDFSVLGLDSDSGPTVHGTFTFPVTMGILFDANVTGNNRIFLTEDSGPTFAADFDDEVDASAGFGPFFGTIAGPVSLTDGQFEVALNGADGEGRVTLASLLANPNTTLTVTPSGIISADFEAQIEGFEGNPITVRGNLTALDNTGLNPIYEYEDDPEAVGALNPETLDSVVVGAHVENMENSPMNLQMLITGSIAASKFIGKTLKKSDDLNPELPVVGQVMTGISIVGDVTQSIAYRLETIWNNSRHDPLEFVNRVEAELEVYVNGTILGTAFPDADDYDGDCEALGNTCVVNIKLVGRLQDGARFTFNDGEGVRHTLGGDLPIDADEVLHADEIAIQFSLGQEFQVTIPSLDSGLDLSPVWQLEFSTGDIEATFGFVFNIGFGLNRDEGFFLLTRGAHSAEDFHTLSLYLRVDNNNINVDSKILSTINVHVGTEAYGEAGTFTIGGAGCGRNDLDAACFHVDFKADSEDEEAPEGEEQTGRASMSSFSNKSKDNDSLIETEIDGILTLVLPVKTNISVEHNGGTIDFPSIITTVDYIMKLPDPGNTEEPDLLHPNKMLRIRETVLDAEDFSEIVVPFLEIIERYNAADKTPIYELLTTELPFPINGTLLDLASAYANATQNREMQRGVVIANFLVHLQETIDTFNDTQHLQFGLGTYYILPEKMYITPDGQILPGLPDLTVEQWQIAVQEGVLGVAAEMAGLNPSIESELEFHQPSFTSGFRGSERPFRFPIFEEASEAFNVLLGKPASIIEFNVESDPLSPYFGFARPFVIGYGVNFSATLFDLDIAVASGHVDVAVSGFLGVRFRLGVGFDTRGFMPGHTFLDGVYFIDNPRDPTGNDDEISAGGSIDFHVNGSISILGGLASARMGGGGGIWLTVGLDFNDESRALTREDRGDGKFHLDEMATVVRASESNVLCVFNYTARFGAYLEWYLKIKALGATVFSTSDRVDLSILDERWECSPDIPLARVLVNSPAVLMLSIGPDAGLRPDDRGDINEVMTVSDIGAKYRIVAFDQTLDVNKCGYATPFNGGCIALIYGDAGLDDDEVVIDQNVTIPVVLLGGPGRAILRGGSGNDVLIGDSGAVAGDADTDELYGGAGNDLIVGMDHDDYIDGGTGHDTIWGDQADHDITITDVRSVTGNNDLNLAPGVPGNDAALSAVGAGTDEIYGRDGDDEIHGGAGEDEVEGNSGADLLYGDAGEDTISGDAGNDEIHGGDDRDDITGDDGNDTISGDNGNDTISGDNGDDVINGGNDDDEITGDDGTDTIHGDDGADHIQGGRDVDFLFGDNGDDVINGNDGNDEIHGGNDGDAIFGDAGQDLIHGDAGNDLIMSGGDNDEIHGGDDDDAVYGGPGVDVIFGDAGQDDLVGGSNIANQPDGVDIIHGGDDEDYIAGDNATITRPGGDIGGVAIRVVTFYDLTSTDSNVFGRDQLFGDNGDDWMWGESGDDWMEGNNDDDTMYGQSGQDDMLGGSPMAGAADGDDTMYGGDGVFAYTQDHDVMCADNCLITRPLSGGNEIMDTFSPTTTGVTRRTVQLLDVATTTFTPPAGSSGNDTVWGDAGRDIQYGQGGNDTLRGGTGDDYMEGNAGNDILYGDAGQDDVVGGTGRTTTDNYFSTKADDVTAVDGRLDGNDTVYGGDGLGMASAADHDVVLGDNARLDRPLDPAGLWIYIQFDQWNREASAVGVAVQRLIVPLDKPLMNVSPGAGTSGADHLNGENGDDVIYGQTGNDVIHGNNDNDVLYGDLGDDDMYGDLGNDVIYGQGGIDRIYGGGGRDTVDGGASDVEFTCAAGARAVPYNDTRSYTADDGRAPGTKGKDEGVKGKTQIKRTNPACLQLVTIEIDVASLDLHPGQEAQLHAIGLYDDGSTADITTQVVWTSSDRDIARVNSAGLVTAVTNGSVTIYATQRGIHSATIAVQVTP